MRIKNNADENKALASNIKRYLKQLNITIPDPKPTKRFEAENRPNLNDLTVKEIRAGRDPLKNEEIRTELMRKMLDQTVHSYLSLELEDTKDVLRHYQAHADTILDHMNTTFTEAVEVLREKHALFGGGDLNSTTQDRHYVARAEATVALNTTQAVLEAWGLLVPFLTGKESGVNERHYTFLNPTLEQSKTHRLFDGRHHSGRALNVWDALNMGLAIELTLDPAEVSNRKMRTSAERDRDRQVDPGRIRHV